MRKLLCSILSLTIAFSLSATTFASFDQSTELIESYNNIVLYAETFNIPLGMTYQEYESMYTSGSISDFENSFYMAMQPNIVPYSSGGGGDDAPYYYNTEANVSEIDATYSTYNLLEVVEVGDVIFEANGGSGVTGHITIVEKIVKDGNGDPLFIQVIEATPDFGVARGILDDTRYDNQAATVMRVSGATEEIIEAAVTFCIGEVGSSYNLDFQKHTSSSERDWYCSELVWAAYKNQGIDIEKTGLNEPGVTPRDIRDSTKTINRTIS